MDESVDGGGAAVSRMVDDQQSVGNEDSVATTEDQSASLGDSDYQENNQVCSKRKRPHAECPWLYTHDWSKEGDLPRLQGKQQCKK